MEQSVVTLAGDDDNQSNKTQAVTMLCFSELSSGEVLAGLTVVWMGREIVMWTGVIGGVVSGAGLTGKILEDIIKIYGVPD